MGGAAALPVGEPLDQADREDHQADEEAEVGDHAQRRRRRREEDADDQVEERVHEEQEDIERGLKRGGQCGTSRRAPFKERAYDSWLTPWGQETDSNRISARLTRRVSITPSRHD